MQFINVDIVNVCKSEILCKLTIKQSFQKHSKVFLKMTFSKVPSTK